PWDSLTCIAPGQLGVAGGVLSALIFVRDGLPALFSPISAAAATILGLPALLGLAVLVGVVVWVIYRLVQWRWWEPWDRAARASFLEECAHAARERLKANFQLGDPLNARLS